MYFSRLSGRHRDRAARVHEPPQAAGANARTVRAKHRMNSSYPAVDCVVLKVKHRCTRVPTTVSVQYRPVHVCTCTL